MFNVEVEYRSAAEARRQAFRLGPIGSLDEAALHPIVDAARAQFSHTA